MYTKQIDRSLMRTEYGVLVCRLLEHLPDDLSPEFGASVVEVTPVARSICTRTMSTNYGC